MNTENVYFAELYGVVGEKQIDPFLYHMQAMPYKIILVKEKELYGEYFYYDLKTGLPYSTDGAVHVGECFINRMRSFNNVTGNKRKYLSKRKILKIERSIKKSVENNRRYV